MENHERVEYELLEQCDQIVFLVECFAWLQCTMRRAARRILSCQTSTPRRWTQIISEWILLRILNLTINVNKLNPMRAGRHIEVANSDEMSGD